MKPIHYLIIFAGITIGILAGLQYKFLKIESCLRSDIRKRAKRNHRGHFSNLKEKSRLIESDNNQTIDLLPTMANKHMKRIPKDTPVVKNNNSQSQSDYKIKKKVESKEKEMIPIKKEINASAYTPCPKNKRFPRPAFVMPGVEKGGTTALYNFLLKHPQILSKKNMQEAGGGSETLFLGEHWNRRGKNEPMEQKRQRYSNMFHTVTNGKNGLGCTPGDPMVLVGDKTPSYMALPKGVEKLFSIAPDARIIISLREPVARALSSYRYFGHFKSKFSVHINDEISLINEFGVLPEDKDVTRFNKFNDILLSRYKRHGRHYHRGAIVGFGLYSVMLYHWMQFFPRNRFLVLFLEEWRGNTNTTMDALNEIFEFLGLPKKSAKEIGNTQRPINKTPKKNEQTKPVSPEDIKRLQQFYKPYNEALEKLLGRKLPRERYYD